MDILSYLSIIISHKFIQMYIEI